MNLSMRLSLLVLLGAGLVLPFQNCAPMSFESADNSLFQQSVTEDELNEIADVTEEELGESVDQVANQDRDEEVVNQPVRDVAANQPSNNQVEDQDKKKSCNQNRAHGQSVDSRVVCREESRFPARGLAGYDFFATRCGSLSNQVCAVVCHVPRGNPSRSHTLIIGVAAYRNAHYPGSHGGNYDGPCQNEQASVIRCSVQQASVAAARR